VAQYVHPRNLGYTRELDASREYTLTLSDADELLIFVPDGQACSAIVPSNASVAFPIGIRVWLEKQFAGTLQIRGASGVSLSRPITLLSGTGQACLAKRGTDTWNVGGIGI
jgi:hypothetical protein